MTDPQEVLGLGLHDYVQKLRDGCSAECLKRALGGIVLDVRRTMPLLDGI